MPLNFMQKWLILGDLGPFWFQSLQWSLVKFENIAWMEMHKSIQSSFKKVENGSKWGRICFLLLMSNCVPILRVLSIFELLRRILKKLIFRFVIFRFVTFPIDYLHFFKCFALSFFLPVQIKNLTEQPLLFLILRSIQKTIVQQTLNGYCDFESFPCTTIGPPQTQIFLQLVLAEHTFEKGESL